MKKVLGLALFLSLLLNAALLLRKPADSPAPAVRTRVVEREVEPAPRPEAKPTPPAGSAVVGLPAPTPVLTSDPKPSVSLTATPAFAAPGEKITVTCSLSGNTSSRHWIGMYVPGAEVTRYSGYRMVHDSAEYVFQAPRVPGPVEFRYIMKDNTTVAAVSNPVMVLGEPPLRPLVALDSGTTTVKAGGEIPATWSLLSGRRTPQDWIGLYAEGAKNENYITWKYVTDADQGRVTLQAPDKPGSYEMRYLLDNGYESVATSVRIVVLP